MKDISRRKFLIGAGNCLAIPFLSSIHLSALAAAAGDVKRFIAFKTNHGHVRGVWNTTESLEPFGDGITSTRDLTSVSGPINPVLDTPEMLALRGKINVIYGLDNVNIDMGHQSPYGSVLGVSPRPENTIDQILANSPHVYPNGTPLRRSVTVTTTESDTNDSGLNRASMSFSNGSLVSAIEQPADLHSILFSNMQDSGGASPAAVIDPRKKIVDQVYEDYVSLVNNPRLSASDRQKLDQHMTVLNDLQNRFQATATPAVVACEKPAAPPSGLDRWAEPEKLDLFFDLLYLALSCDLTRVVAFPLSTYQGIIGIKQYHTGSQGAHARYVPGIIQHHNTYARKIGQFLSRLDSTSEGSGSMLDNSLVYWGQELGNMSFDGTSSHYYLEQVALTAGGLGGAFQTGRFVEYRRMIGGKHYGFPVNNMLETIMMAFGLQPGEYESTPGEGYGPYALSNDKQRALLRAGYDGNIVRNNPLPALLT